METTVNQRISGIISELKITKNSFAEKLGVAGSVIYNIINNRNKPGFDLLEKIVSSFDVNPEYLLIGKGDIFSSKSGAEMNTNFVPKVSTSEKKNIDSDLSRAFILMLCSSYNKKNGTNFSYNSFSDLSSSFSIIADYADFLQTMLESEVIKEVFVTAKFSYAENGTKEGVIPEELDAILDKYVKIYDVLYESAVQGVSVMDDLNGLMETLKKKFDNSK